MPFANGAQSFVSRVSISWNIVCIVTASHYMVFWISSWTRHGSCASVFPQTNVGGVRGFSPPSLVGIHRTPSVDGQAALGQPLHCPVPKAQAFGNPYHSSDLMFFLCGFQLRSEVCSACCGCDLMFFLCGFQFEAIEAAIAAML